MDTWRFCHLPLSCEQVLLRDGGLGSLREMGIGVDVKNEGPPLVRTSESGTLLLKSSSWLTYVNFVIAPARYAVQLAKKSDIFSLKMSPIFLSEVVAFFVVRSTRASRCSDNAEWRDGYSVGHVLCGVSSWSDHGHFGLTSEEIEQGTRAAEEVKGVTDV